MKKLRIILALIVVTSLFNCSGINRLKKGDTLDDGKSVVFARYIFRFQGRIRKYYTGAFFNLYDATKVVNAYSKPVTFIRAEKSRKVEAWSMKPGIYKMGRYRSGRFVGFLSKGVPTFTVKAGKVNYIGTIIFTLNGDMRSVNVNFVVGDKAFERSKEIFTEYFPGLVAKYPFHFALKKPKNLDKGKDDSGEGE